MARPTPVTFLDKSFCFTGKMSELLRKDAEREVRARGGLTQSSVNKDLDYLVVGDIPNPTWAYGDYGSKIAKAMDFKAQGKRKPRTVSESDFLEDLASTSPTNSGAIDTKVIICTYHVTVDEPSAFGLDALADELSGIEDCAVKIKAFPAGAMIIFAEDGVTEGTDGWDLRVRVTKVAGLAYVTQPLVDAVAHVLGGRFGDAGHLSWTEKAEGSADFVRYLREIPKAQRVQILADQE